MRAIKPELSIHLSLRLAWYARRHVATATERVKAAELARYPDSHGEVADGFIRKLNSTGPNSYQPKSVTIFFGFGLDRRASAFSPFEARVLRAAMQEHLDTANYINHVTQDALKRRVRQLDAWLDVPIVDRLASLDDERAQMVIACR